jgi:uncharacterized membrane protein
MREIAEIQAAPQEREAVPAGSTRRRRLFTAAFLVVISIIASVPFSFMGSPAEGEQASFPRLVNTHDLFAHFEQMRSFYQGLASGEIYPRWEQDTNLGFGAPTTSYYPPGVYYVTSAFFALTKDWAWALLWSHLFMMLAAAAAMYLYAKQTMKPNAALVATTAYTLLPYHLLDQYQRGALAELLCFVWMPLILLFVDRLLSRRVESQNGKTSQWTNVAGLAATYGAFLWSHPPTAYQFSLALGLYIALKAALEREWKGLIMTGAGIALGLALSAAYLLPAFLHQDLIHHEFINQAWPYHQSYIFWQPIKGEPYSPYSIILISMWAYGAATITILAALLIALKSQDGTQSRAFKKRVALWAVMGCFASFMMVGLSEAVGRMIPKIEIGVFAWRMLSITTLVVALLLGASAQAMPYLLRQRRRLQFAALGAVVSIAVAAGLAITVLGGAGPAMREPLFTPQVRYYNPATVPSSVPISLFDLPEAQPAELAGNGNVTVERWDPHHRVIEVEAEADDLLMVRTFNFPGWTATIDGNPAQIITGLELGDIQITSERR